MHISVGTDLDFWIGFFYFVIFWTFVVLLFFLSIFIYHNFYLYIYIVYEVIRYWRHRFSVVYLISPIQEAKIILVHLRVKNNFVFYQIVHFFNVAKDFALLIFFVYQKPFIRTFHTSFKVFLYTKIIPSQNYKYFVFIDCSFYSYCSS